MIQVTRREALLEGSLKKITLSQKADAPEYTLTVVCGDLTDHHITELLALHKMGAIHITLWAEDPQHTFAFDADKPVDPKLYG